MADMLDRMIANHEWHMRECEQRELTAFQQEHNGRIDLAFAATAHRINSKTAKRRQDIIVSVCEEVWKQVMDGEHTKVVVEREIHEKDREYYNNMATPLIKAQLGLNPPGGGKAILEVRVYRDDLGSGSSGKSFLKVTVCPHP